MVLIRNREEVKLSEFEYWINAQIEQAKLTSHISANGSQHAELCQRWEAVLDKLALAMALNKRLKAWYED